ncbi:MATE family efflux transporter [Vibrio renipiscarius]|uniref:MATE family efflux transporter n=1 Tax=Vibrio renipiscarius TaxID=1461322 RepID=UPI00354C7A43
MRNILTLAFPLIISQLISMALVLTDVWMMSRLSISALAAGGLGASIYSFVFIVASSTIGCVANLIAIAYGQRVARPDHGNQQIRFAIKGAVLLSVMLSAVLITCFNWAPELLRFAQQPESVIDPAMQYVNALKWAMLPSLLLLVLRGLTSAFGNVRSIMVMSSLTIFLNVPLSYLLAFTFDFGLAGLGAGTVLAASFVMVGYAFWVFQRDEFKAFSPWKNVHEYSFSLLKPLLAMGLPIALAALLEHGLIYGGTLMAGTIAVAALALHQILLQCLSFTWNINFGFAQASAILVGQQYGAQNYRAIKHIAVRSFLLTTVISVVLCGGFLLWPEFIAHLFNLDEPLTALLSSVLWVVALSFMVDAWQLLAINLLRGMKIVIGPTIITAVGYWLFGLPAAWWLLKPYQLTGIWAGIGIGLAVTGVLLLVQLIVATRQHEKCSENAQLEH